MPNDAIGIKTFNVTKNFKLIKALKGLNINIEASLLHGLIGPEGAGKTTFLRCITGLLTPTEGEIKYFSNGKITELGTIREAIAYMPQTQSLYADLSINEHLDFFKALYKIPQDIFEFKKEELLNVTRLTKFKDRPAGKLSGGMYKKLGLMCSLLRNPNVILLDEPTNGVDPISRREFWELLYHLADQNVTILVATAYMDEAERCSRVHILDSGKLLDSDEPKELLRKYQVKNFDQFFLKRSEENLGSNEIC